MWRNWSPHTLLMGCKNDIAALENNLAVPQKIKHRNYHITQQLHSSTYTQEKRNQASTQNLCTNVHTSIIPNSPSTDKWIDNEILCGNTTK